MFYPPLPPTDSTLAVGGVRFVSYGLIGMVLVEYGMILPRLGALLALPFFARVLVVFALVGPIAVCLGVFMPIALERLKGTAPALVPWAWGVNGIFSVVAPIVSVAWSMTWGINALLLVACLTYLAAAPALPPLPEELGPASRRVA